MQPYSLLYHSLGGKIIVLILFCLCSCSLPNGVSIGPVDNSGQKTVTLTFNQVALKFDLSEKVITGFVASDYSDLITAHNVVNQDWYRYSGTIENLSSLLWNVDAYDEDHKPSITVTIEDLVTGKIEHKCKKEDISGNTVFGIPNVSKFQQGTVEIKSIKTNENGVQVVWKKSALKSTWPINEFIADGTISCDVTAIIKVGTNNRRGSVATRKNAIITNTSDKTSGEPRRLVVDDRQLISPNLRKPVLVNGDISKDVKWSEPVIYKEIQL